MTNISEKTTGSCKDREYIVTEVCPHCEAEVEMRWNVAADGYKAFCPHCGKRLMLCDACQHPEGKCVENCDYTSEPMPMGTPSAVLHAGKRYALFFIFFVSPFCL